MVANVDVYGYLRVSATNLVNQNEREKIPKEFSK
jgi:hypothetical protein